MGLAGHGYNWMENVRWDGVELGLVGLGSDTNGMTMMGWSGTGAGKLDTDRGRVWAGMGMGMGIGMVIWLD